MWLVEQRAAVVPKPGARRPTLVKNRIQIQIDPGAGILTVGYEKPHHGSRCLDGNVESVM